MSKGTETGNSQDISLLEICLFDTGIDRRSSAEQRSGMFKGERVGEMNRGTRVTDEVLKSYHRPIGVSTSLKAPSVLIPIAPFMLSQ
jgi:hypothetical protein